MQLLPKTNLIARAAPVIWRPFKPWTSLLCGQVALSFLGHIYERPVDLGCESRLRARRITEARMLSRAAFSETNGFEGDHAVAFEVLCTSDLSGGHRLSIHVLSVQVGYRVPK